MHPQNDTPVLDEITLARNLDDAIELARRQPGAAISFYRLPEQFVADQIELRAIPAHNVLATNEPGEPPRLFAIVPAGVNPTAATVCISAVPGPIAETLRAQREAAADAHEQDIAA